jgi:hypothetical protein
LWREGGDRLSPTLTLTLSPTLTLTLSLTLSPSLPLTRPPYLFLRNTSTIGTPSNVST